jgi:DNA-binding NarL/FixJ family response regulator
MSSLETQSVAELEPKGKAPGLVWVVCSHPVIARGLESVLKDKAQVHLGDAPPEDVAPSSVILCPHSDDAEDIASEVKRVKEIVPHAPILLFGLGVDQQVFQAAFGGGASGYLHSGLLPEQIISAVSLASAGEIVVPKEFLKGLVEEVAPIPRSALTPRQREILVLVAQGLSNAEIAKRLHLTENTIKQHLRHAYKTLKVKNRTEATRLWSGS